MFNEGKNAHSGHRFLQKYLGDNDWISVDLDVFPGRRREVSRRFDRHVIASCVDEEAARAAFRLLADEVPAQAGGPDK
jgi:hypothetical protein